MKLIFSILVLVCISISCFGQGKIGETVVIKDEMKSRVLKDGTTIYDKIDTINRTYVADCPLCSKPAFVIWKESTGMQIPNILGYIIHPPCFGKGLDYLKKKLKLYKEK